MGLYRIFSLELRKWAETSARLLLNKLRETSEIRRKEVNVSHEILGIIERQSGNDLGIVAHALLEHLKKNYITRKWMVMVFSDKNLTDIRPSKGFHTASTTNTFAAAMSIDESDSPDFTDYANALLQDFRFPVETVTNVPFGLSLKTKDLARDFHQHFNKFLAPLPIEERLGIESVAIATPCSTSEKKMDHYFSVLTSSSFKWTKITNQDECVNKQLIVIPTCIPIYDEIANEKTSKQYNGVLRNEFGRAYLSVEGNSKEDGAYVTADGAWRNRTGQKWTFVNNQLKNENGKCLTAWTERSTYLYQYDCHPDWAGQVWIRHGLQIVNGFRFCLSVRERREDSAMYVVQDMCDSTPPFIWYNAACHLPLGSC